MGSFADATQDDNAILAADFGEEMEIYRNGVLLRPVTGCYAPRPEVVTGYTMENTVQRASITIFDLAEAAGLLVTDTVVVPNVGERQFFGKPKVNAFGWTTWELVGA